APIGGVGGAHADTRVAGQAAGRRRDAVARRRADGIRGEGLNHLTVQVERDNGNGRRFYERAGFAEPRELTHDVEGYVLPLVEYRRLILGRLLSGLAMGTQEIVAVDLHGHREVVVRTQ